MQKLGFMLAKEWTEGMKVPREFKDKKFAPEGWLMSEKKDGLRARYNPETKRFISRNNKPYNAPSWFIESMPNVHLDGELFCGRGNFEKMGGARRKVPLNSDWFNYKFHVYDAPEMEATFDDRYKSLEKLVKEAEEHWNIYKKDLGEEFEKVTCPLVLTNHYVVESIEHMKEYYQKVLDLGGEGIMLKNPSSDYENKRSNHLLKVKPDFDREAIIVDYKDGTGKYEGKLGAFICKQLINHDSYMTIDNVPDHEFATSGMNDEVRDNYKLTHPIGTVITFKCSGYTNSGKSVARTSAIILTVTSSLLNRSPAYSTRKLFSFVFGTTAIPNTGFIWACSSVTVFSSDIFIPFIYYIIITNICLL